ncbi:MAG: AsmA-like C-terminal region-containing protein, partial [Pseudomonadota bacterium]
LDLSSRWLDLDRLSVPFGALEAAEKPEQGRMMPLKVARGLFSRLIGVLPSTTDLQARVAFDQVNLGGEGVSNVNMVLAGSGGPLEMRSLSASLPGGARFDFSGELKPADGGAAFDGTVFVGGPSLVRLLRWAFPDYGRLEQVSDGVFSLSGRMLLGADIVSLDNGIANFSGMPVRGRVKWQDAPNTKLSVQLEGYQLDTRWVGLDQLRLIDLLDQERSGSRAQAAKEPETATATVQVVGEDGAEAGPAQPGAAVASTEGVRFSGADDVEVSLRAGKLINGPNTLKDFDAVISAKSGKVKITKLAFKTADGLKVSTIGDVAQGQETPSGAFQFTVASDTQRGTGSLLSLLSEQGLLSDRSRDDLALVLDGAAPYRLGGQFSIGKSGAKAIVGTIDGDVQGRQAAGQLRLDGGLEGWRTAPLLVHLNLKTDHAVKSLRQVLDKLGALGPTDGGLETARVAGRGVPGALIFQAEGITDTGLDWVGDLRADGLDVTWSGTGKASDAGFAMASGNVDVKTARAGDLAALAGWPVGESVRSTKIAGTFDLTSEGSGVKISSKDMTFGGVSLAGEVALASDGDGTSKTGEAVDPPLKVSGALTASSISLDDMMAGLLRETPLVVPAPRVAAGPPSAPGPVSDATPFVSPQPAQLFSDQSFDLKLLKAFSGDLRLNARTLIFEPGLSAKNSELRLRFDGAGAIDVDLTKATSAAGTVSARLKLAQPSGGTGANVDGTLKVSGGRLQNILGRTGEGKPAGRGPFSLNAKFSGRGLTPRDLSLALRGSGTVQFKGAQLNGLAPGALADAAEGLLSREPDQSIEGEIAPTLAASLGQGTLKLGSTKVPFRIVDGGVRFAELAIRADGGRVRGVTTIDVLSLNVDSAWSVVAASRFDGKPDWPVVNSVFVGPLKSLHQLRPQISSGAFERELAVQRLERNALRLEELRAEDEARAEEARLRAEELERQREEEARLAREEAARLAREEAIRRRAREAAEDDAYRISPPGSQF